MMRSGFLLSLIASIPLISATASASKSQDVTIREVMCKVPKAYYATKGKIKAELNKSIAAALSAEGVGSLAALAVKAKSQPLRYLTMSVLDGAVFSAAITDNRSVLVDLATLEENLCRTSSKGRCNQKVADLMVDKESFQRTVRDQYEYFQTERENKGVPAKNEPVVDYDSVPMSLYSTCQERLKELNKLEGLKDLQASKVVLPPGSMKELSDLLPKNPTVDMAQVESQCVNKVQGALKETYANTNATNVVDNRKNGDKEIQRKLAENTSRDLKDCEAELKERMDNWNLGRARNGFTAPAAPAPTGAR